MKKNCEICNKEFETIKFGHTRKFCFECVPQTENLAERTLYKRQAAKKEGVKRLGGKCIHCGETKYYLLDFHHVNDDKEGKPAELLCDSRLEDFFIEIDKCVLLCGNCHRELHWLKSNEKDFNENEYLGM